MASAVIQERRNQLIKLIKACREHIHHTEAHCTTILVAVSSYGDGEDALCVGMIRDK